MTTIEFRDLSDASLRRAIMHLATAGGQRYVAYSAKSSPPCWIQSELDADAPWIESRAMPAARQLLQLWMLEQAFRFPRLCDRFCDAVERCVLIEQSLELEHRVNNLRRPC
jgi:hypothetical protein